MACASQSMVTANSCSFSSRSQRTLSKPRWPKKKKAGAFSVNASSSSDESADCNTEECAPDKEVGTVSMEWLAGDRTKVVGTFPPRKKGWTGYVDKDTAGQTNIYSVEPAVYVAESAISSGTAGSSSEGAENTAAIAAGLAIISIAAASSVLIQVNKNEPRVQRVDYDGPPLSFYINKFKPDVAVVSSLPPAPELSPESASTAGAPAASEPSSSLDQQAEASPTVIPEAQLDPTAAGNS